VFPFHCRVVGADGRRREGGGLVVPSAVSRAPFLGVFLVRVLITGLRGCGCFGGGGEEHRCRVSLSPPL